MELLSYQVLDLFPQGLMGKSRENAWELKVTNGEIEKGTFLFLDELNEWEREE